MWIFVPMGVLVATKTFQLREAVSHAERSGTSLFLGGAKRVAPEERLPQSVADHRSCIAKDFQSAQAVESPKANCTQVWVNYLYNFCAIVIQFPLGKSLKTHWNPLQFLANYTGSFPQGSELHRSAQTAQKWWFSETHEVCISKHNTNLASVKKLRQDGDYR